MQKDLVIRGAREHNLKNLNLTIPRDKLIVFTGLSGSGKTSLAFDTIYAEGQRRYVESLSSYARQFLGQMEKPNVDSIDGLSPAISIDQKTTSKNPRSTVGTVTEIYDYLRLLYARVGVPHCPECGREIARQTVDDIVDKLMALPEGTRFQLLAPIVRGRKGEYQKELEQARKSGYVRTRVDGIVYDLSEEIKMDKNKKHDVEIVVDRLVMRPDLRRRLTDSVETATRLAEGLLIVSVADGEELLFSQNYACPEHGFSMEELAPRIFSFNNPYGACTQCGGIGSQFTPDRDLILPNKELSINEGAIHASGWRGDEGGTIARMYFEGLARYAGFSLDIPVRDLPEFAIDMLLWGTKGKKISLQRSGSYGSGTYFAAFEGVANNMLRRYKESNSDWAKQDIEQYMRQQPCPACRGQRLKPEVLCVTVGSLNIMQFTHFSVVKALAFLDNLTLKPRDQIIAEQILKEIKERLRFLRSVGLEYLNLSRAAGTLSGGEAQRIRLATQIGSGLMGVLYILDEPSIGLHQKDNNKLLATLKKLRDLGNTLIVVEHDEDTMYHADHIIDMGLGAGEHGGSIVIAGNIEDIKACKDSLTGQYLAGVKSIPIPDKRRSLSDRWVTVCGARENNLKNIEVKFPVGVLTCVTGVSGSGKSSLVNEILYNKLSSVLNKSKHRAGDHDAILGCEYLDKVINIDQSPIGRTPRSNPATYTGVFDLIRDVFANTAEAKMRGYKGGRFSFNVRGGRCEACSGDGIIKIEMHFLPDVYVPCEVCKGKRYNRETLEVRYKDANIADVLDMTVEKALEHFKNIPRIMSKIRTLYDVGLGYIKLGQPSTTLSGGEAQRIKLATELSKRSTGNTMYILDEPTTGLHIADVHRLIEILQKFADSGNTVIVIEHNLEIIKTADYIIDLGPEGGMEGGRVIATGAPEQVCENEGSYTGQFLKKTLKKEHEENSEKGT